MLYGNQNDKRNHWELLGKEMRIIMSMYKTIVFVLSQKDYIRTNQDTVKERYNQVYSTAFV